MGGPRMPGWLAGLLVSGSIVIVVGFVSGLLVGLLL